MKETLPRATLIGIDGRPLRTPVPGDPSLAERWLKTHRRWQGTIDTTIKTVGGSWLVMSLVSSLLVNAYLKTIGQRGVPLDLGGTWAMLALMGIVLVAVLAALAAMFIVGETIMQPLHPVGPIPLTTRMAFFLGASASLLALFGMQNLSENVAVAIVVAVPAGLVVGFGTFRLARRQRQNVGMPKVLFHLTLWIMVSSALFLVLAADIDTLLRIQFDGTEPLFFAFSVSLVQMALCTFIPRMPAYFLTLAVVSFVVVGVSPGAYVITLVALDATNQGGGLPAASLVTPGASTTCNLGIGDRPVLYRVATGCTKAAALAHLKQITSATSSFQKAQVIARWKCHAAKHVWKKGTCSVQ